MKDTIMAKDDWNKVMIKEPKALENYAEWTPEYGDYPATMPNGNPWPELKLDGHYGHTKAYGVAVTNPNGKTVEIGMLYDGYNRHAGIHLGVLAAVTEAVLGFDNNDARNFMFTKLLDRLKEANMKTIEVFHHEQRYSTENVEELVRQGQRSPRP